MDPDALHILFPLEVRGPQNLEKGDSRAFPAGLPLMFLELTLEGKAICVFASGYFADHFVENSWPEKSVPRSLIPASEMQGTGVPLLSQSCSGSPRPCRCWWREGGFPTREKGGNWRLRAGNYAKPSTEVLCLLNTFWVKAMSSFKMRYSWWTILNKFQAYNIVIQKF